MGAEGTRLQDDVASAIAHCLQSYQSGAESSSASQILRMEEDTVKEDAAAAAPLV